MSNIIDMGDQNIYVIGLAGKGLGVLKNIKNLGGHLGNCVELKREKKGVRVKISKNPGGYLSNCVELKRLQPSG